MLLGHSDNMIENWLTIGMSPYNAAGTQDTSRLMHATFPGLRAYIDPPPPFAAWKRLDGALFQWRLQRDSGMSILRPPLPIPSRVDVGRFGVRRQTDSLRRLLSRLWGRQWSEQTAVYVTNWSYAMAGVVAHLQPRHLIVDLVDDVLAFPYDVSRERVHRSITSLVRQAAVVTAVSPSLADAAITTYGVTPIMLPNGVDDRRFRTADIPGWCSAQLDVLRLQQPNQVFVGFAGTLNHWIDYASLLHLVRTHSALKLVLIGKTSSFGSEQTERLYRELLADPRVTALGPVAYEELPACLHRLDILVLPRLPGPASAASSPLKLLEYLSVGKPVIVSGVPMPADAQPLVYGGEARDVERPLQQALAEMRGASPPKIAERQQYAANHSWTLRMESVLRAVRESCTHNGKHSRLDT